MYYQLEPMTEDEAGAVLTWRYEPPYDVYNVETAFADEAVREFLRPEYAYHAIRTPEGELVGFCCYGPDARVPGGEYDEPALDVGIGLRPDLTGRGLGPRILDAVLDNGREKYAPAAFRTTVATFNERSRRLFEGAGFEPERTFRTQGNRGGDEWVQLRLEAWGS